MNTGGEKTKTFIFITNTILETEHWPTTKTRKHNDYKTEIILLLKSENTAGEVFRSQVMNINTVYK